MPYSRLRGTILQYFNAVRLLRGDSSPYYYLLLLF